MINRFKAFVRANQRYLPVISFMVGFLWDSLTLGRIDRLYDQVILCTYLSALSVSLYLFNLADDEKWKGTFIERYEPYFPLAIQFFLGGLSSAYVIYFSRSVSFSKTSIFFIILVILLFANEMLKKRISNKYLQLGAYFFVNFTFFTFFIPVLVGTMNQFIFLISGAVSLGTTLALIIYIYNASPSTRKEVGFGKILGVVIIIYALINTFYFFNLIPPVPLALDTGLVAHHVEKQENEYIVSYEREPWYKFWKDNRHEFLYKPGDSVFVYTSIFAPSDFSKRVLHRWKWYNERASKWIVMDEIGYEITGGRDEGYRGYTYKTQIVEGEWEVDVITKEGLVLGIIKFRVKQDSTANPERLIERTF